MTFDLRYGALVEFSTDRKSGAGDLQKCKDALKHHNVTDWKVGLFRVFSAKLKPLSFFISIVIIHVIIPVKGNGYFLYDTRHKRPQIYTKLMWFKEYDSTVLPPSALVTSLPFKTTPTLSLPVHPELKNLDSATNGLKFSYF